MFSRGFQRLTILMVAALLFAACWSGRSKGSNDVIQVTDQNGSAWGGPAAAITHDGVITVAWADVRLGLPMLRFTTVNGDRVAPSRPVAVPPELFRQDSPYMIADMHDGLHLAWTQWLPGGGPFHVYYAFKPARASTWQAERLDVGVGGISPRLSVDSAGAVHAVWQGASQSGIFYRRRDPTGQWSEIERLTLPRQAGLHARPAIAVDTASRVHVAWHSLWEGQSRVYHAIRSPVGWSEAHPVDPDGPAGQTYARLAPGANGQVYLAWEDDRATVLRSAGSLASSDVFFAVWTVDVGWDRARAATGQIGDVFRCTLFLAAGARYPSLAWVEIPEGDHSRVVVTRWLGDTWDEAYLLDPQNLTLRQDKPVLLTNATGNGYAVWLGGGELVEGPNGGTIYLREMASLNSTF